MTSCKVRESKQVGLGTEEKHEKTGNVKLRHFYLSLVPWKSNKYYIFMCVCGRLSPSAWAWSCACVHVALLILHATIMRHVVTSFVAFQTPPYFSTLSQKRQDFRGKVAEYKMCVFIFSTHFFLKHYSF